MGSKQTVSHAFHEPATAATPTSSAADSGCDIVLLMDSSGSMKRTDPGNYRKNAAKLFISLLGKNDRISIMSFGDSASLLLPLTQSTRENRTSLFGAVEKITSKALFTNITEAVQKGFEELRKSSGRSRIIIMMSDGKIDLGSPDKDEQSRGTLLSILPELAAAQIPLYTVAFTAESDEALLAKMAGETKGFFRFAKADRDVHVMFSSIFEKIKSPDVVPFDGQSFTIDADIREAVLLVTKEPSTAITVLDPAGKAITASQHTGSVEWYASAVFDMVSIREPRAGNWRVKFSTSEGNRLYVLTNLHLKTSFDGREIPQGQSVTIEAWLEKQGGIVREKNILETVQFSADVAGPKGISQVVKLAPASGATGTRQDDSKFIGKLVIDEPGDYRIKLLAEGKTFQREKSIAFKVAEGPAGRKPSVVLKEHPAEAAVSWTSVLIRFGVVNLVLLAAGGIGFGIRVLVMKMRPKR